MNESNIRSADGKGFTREAYNAIRKAHEVAEYIAQNFAGRIRDLVALGFNQTDIAELFAAEELRGYHYGTAQILRTATSEAVRAVLSPQQAEDLRLRSWRSSLASNATSEGRSKGTRSRNAIHGLPGGAKEWTSDEESELVRVAKSTLWPNGSQYAGKTNWSAVTEIMHGHPHLPRRASNAYKQRYSLLEAAAASVVIECREEHFTHPQTDDIEEPPQRAAV